MKIHEVSIRRPVAILMCVLMVLVLGGVSFSRLPIDLMPEMDFPISIVLTSYSGVGPQEIENIITRNIESAVATVNNIKTIQSQSSEGQSIVIAEFNSGTDMNFATLQMREKIDMVKGMLPDGVEAPMIIKMDPGMIPAAVLGVSGGENEAELTRFVEDKIKAKIESIDGVASVAVTGGTTKEIKVNLDSQKLSGYGLSFSQISGALRSENLNQPGGTVEYGDKSLLVRSTGEFQSLDQIRNIPITLPTGAVVYLRDMAEVKEGYKSVDTYNRMNGESSIGLTVQKQTDSNTVKVVNLIKKEINNILKEYPDVKVEMVFDQGEYVEQSIANVAKNAVVGAILAIIILFVFLKNIRTTMIIGTSIPISIIATFVMIYFSGITLNLVSLGGLALGVGMLVDNAIVVLENIYRYRNEGHSRVEAAMLGTQEVGSAVLASTLTTVVVFLPIVFTGGIAAEIFKQMALAVTFSLIASLLVALTLIPMLSSKFLKMVKYHEASRSERLNKVFDKWEDTLSAVDNFYRSILSWALAHRRKTVITVLAIFAGSLLLIPFVGTEFFPNMDMGQFTVGIELPQGSLLKNTNEVAEQVEGMLNSLPEIQKVFTTVGSSGSGMDLSGGASNTASLNITLKPLSERKRSTAEVVEEMRNKVRLIPGADIEINEVSTSAMGVSGGTAVSVKICGPDLDKLSEIAADAEELIKKVEGVRQANTSISEGRPEAQIYVNRDKASYYGLGTAQVSAAIRTAVEGSVATTYKVDGDEIDVRVGFPEETGEKYSQLIDTKILSPLGVEVPLTEIADIKMEKGPISITREGQERYVTVSSDVFGRSTGDVNKDISERLDEMLLPPGYSIKYGGEAEQIADAFSSLTLALLLAIVLVYMVMAAQFESLLHPFTIMFSLPLAFTGSVLGLVLTGRALSVPAFIGVIMLAGIVVNNAIVLVDYINTLRGRGMDRLEAILKAGPTRLRPILMTTLTTILGLIPLALGIGEGAEAQAPMATVVIGGLTTSTVLTLVIIPVIYTLFDDVSVKLRRHKAGSIRKTEAV
ncbi:MAG TPA: efflux RND transporter permease subunit [Bacillota bacterium]|nr:efflux RND transporter permease subunit [Clostridiaceae bacterium]HNR05049.1 efflux RND transporter permease subunit [Bacillota bacterium]HQO42789.1 efflux RND transporter permease subunit [Bacillota bacterium]HQQ43866.1 efflux RND transporter permease subunit [Bacillota bacterium]